MDYTDKLRLRKPTYDEYGDVNDINYNSDILDEEVAKRVKSVNGKLPDDNGSVLVSEVPFAQNLTADDAQQSSGEFLFRTTGGDASLTDGDATLVSVFGRMVHTGVVPESLEMTVESVTREEGEEPITAEINRDTFVAYVETSSTITLVYTDAWSANPTLYGVTVIGTPIAGDRIIIEYVKADRGTITPATPSAFRSTGWNLYNNTLGYARVKRYSEAYGFLIGGSYTAVQFAQTVEGTKSTITPINGYFIVPADGYVFVTGGDATSTYILMTWSDWTNGYTGDFQAYTEDTISFASVMTNYFPNGLCSVGNVSDEIGLNSGYAVSRITRMDYTEENIAIAQQSGRPYDADTNYIYLVKEIPETYAIGVSGVYDAYDHGMEIIDGSTVPVYVQTLYGQNLKDKLRTDVVTISQQTLTSAQQTQVRNNLSAASQADVDALNSKIATATRNVLHGESAIKTYLSSVASGLEMGNSKLVSISNDDSGFAIMTPYTTYQGYLCVTYKSASETHFVWTGYNTSGKDVTFGNANGTWTVNSVNSNLQNLIKTASYALTEQTTIGAHSSKDFVLDTFGIPSSVKVLGGIISSYNDANAQELIVYSSMWYGTQYVRVGNFGDNACTLSSGRIIQVYYC